MLGSRSDRKSGEESLTPTGRTGGGPDGNLGNTKLTQSVDRAFAILEELVETSTPRSALELSRATGLNRSVVHRLLQTLLAWDYAARTDDGQYVLGAKALLPSAAFTERNPLRQVCLPYLVDLSNRLAGKRPLVVSLCVPADAYVVVIERVWNPRVPLTGLPSLRSRLPIIRCAHGRVMLASFGEEAVTEALAAAPVNMPERLAAIRANGLFEWADSEISPGVSSMAAAILGANGAATGCVALSGPTKELVDEDGSLEEGVRRTAQIISQLHIN